MATGRNESCPCGSGRKYKKCCYEKTEHPTLGRTNTTLIAVFAVLVTAAIGATVALRPSKEAPPPAQAAASPSAPASGPAATPQASSTPDQASQPAPGAGAQPPGPAPPGKVWSAEHGHWHDSPIQISSTPSPMPKVVAPPRPNTPQPPGPVPPGKVWSPEHAHWHDAATPQLPVTVGLGGDIQAGGTTVPTSAPPGQVWSAEHGHFHRAPANTAAGTQVKALRTDTGTGGATQATTTAP